MDHPPADAVASALPGRGPIRGALTTRALLIGLLISAFVNLGSPYTESTGFSNFSWSYLPEGGAVPFLVLLLLNGLVGRLWPRRALSARELLVILAMGLVANSTSLFLAYFWLAAIVSPHYFASPENRWQDDLIPHLPRALIVSDRHQAAFRFYEGLPPGASIPWRDWLVPIGAWLPLLLALLVGAYAMVELFRRQWLEHEKLSYPLMQLPVELVRESVRGGQRVGLYRRTAFWAGVGLPFGIAALDVVHGVWPQVPSITVDHLGGPTWGNLQLSPHFPPLWAGVSFLALGIGWFVPSDVLFSVWFLYLLIKIIEVGLLQRAGLDIGQAGMFVWGSAAAAWQSFGAFLVFMASVLYSARGRLRELVSLASGRSGGSDPYALLAPRTTLIVLGGCLLVAGGWLVHYGMPLPVVALFLPLVMLIYLYLARIVCQAGIFYVVPPQIAQNVCIWLFGPRAIGRQGMLALGLSYSWHGDVQTVLSALSAESVRLQQWARCPGSELTRGILASVVLGLIVAPLGIIITGYRHGAIAWPTWVFKGWGPSTYQQVLGQIAAPGAFQVAPLIYSGVGAGVMGLLTMLHHRFVWWPLHPLGLAVASSFTMYAVYLGFFVAWAAKLVILRWGGVSVYRGAVPFFTGLPVGHYAGRALTLVVMVLRGGRFTL